MSTIINATTTNGVVIQPDNSGSLVLQTNSGTTALTIDTSQNVGIGTSSPFAKLTVKTATDRNLLVSTNGVGNINDANNAWQQTNVNGNPLIFGYGQFAAEAMRIDSSGNVGIGTTSPSTFSSSSTSFVVSAPSLGTPTIALESQGGWSSAIRTTSSGNMIFYNNASTERMRIDSGGAVNINRTSGGGKLNVTGDLWLYATTAGAGNSTLKYNSGTGQVTYDASSRYYKENIQDLEYGLSSVMAMKPRKYVYKATGVIDIGFIADEMLPLVPEITPLANNSINDMGVPDGEPFTVNYDRLTAVLVKAIQEQQTIINDLKARVETLEAK